MVSDQALERALLLIEQGGATYEYFFARLDSADWIEPLHRRGRFDHPPRAVSNGKYIQFPRWAEGEYLERMAEQAPELVFQALPQAAFESDNHPVHQLLLQIAAKLPHELAARIIEREATWVSGQPVLFGLYSERAADALINLLGKGESHAAKALLDSMLSVREPSEKPESTTLDDGTPFRWSADPVGRLDTWDIEVLIGRLTDALTAAVPERGLALLVNKLAAGITIHDNGRGNQEDYSTIWRPHIAHGNHRDLLDVLVSSVQGVTQKLVRDTPGGYEVALRVFATQLWPIFRRFEAYALAEAGSDVPQDFRKGILLDPSRYRDATANPEFNELVGLWAKDADDHTRAALLGIVDGGPDLGAYSNYLAQEDEVGPERKERWLRDDWRLRWLTALEGALDPQRTEELDALRKEYGPARPAFSTGGARAIGHTSDISDEQLRKYTFSELVEFLRLWQPPPMIHPEAPSRAGLAQLVSRLIAESPQYFAENLKSFEDVALHPTFVRTAIDSFTGVLKSGSALDVYPVLHIIAWLFQSTHVEQRGGFKWEEDPDWSWAYMSSARFLTELFLHADLIEIGRIQELWIPLTLVASSPWPKPEDEIEYRKSHSSIMMALNDIRPVGLEAVMRFARWLKQTKPDDLPVEFGSALELLTEHIDPRRDESVAVKEIFGVHISLLAWLDTEWLKAQLTNLFPEKPFRVQDKFAWRAFLLFGQPIAPLLPEMRFRYGRAIRSLNPKESEVSEDQRALGRHLMLFVAWGKLQLEDELVVSFFENASESLRSQALGDVGWQLGQDKAAAIDEEIAARLMKLLEWRFETIALRSDRTSRELSSFGWWLRSGKFPAEWSIRFAVAIVERFLDLSPDFAAAEGLATLAEQYPFETAHCLAVLAENDREGWSVYSWQDNGKKVLRTALKHGGQSKAEAERAIDRLVSRGHTDYRGLR